MTAVQTYNVPSIPEWLGVHENSGSARGVFVDYVKLNYSADPMLTIGLGKIFSKITPSYILY